MVSGTALLVAASGLVQAADLLSGRATPAFVPPPVFSWNGFYVGAFAGGGSGRSNFADPFGSSIYGDSVRTPFIEGGGQVGFNYQGSGSPFVFGLEADGGAVGLNGTNTCLAFSGFYLPGNCRARANALATGTGRVGYAFGPDGRTLGYVKGGVAGLFGSRSITTNSAGIFGALDATTSTATRVGYTVGIGVEQTLSSAWSIKIEYDYMNFGSSSMAVPGSALQVFPPQPLYLLTGRATTTVRQDLHEIKVGLNYHIGAPGGDFNNGFGLFNAPVVAATALTPYSFTQNGFAVEAGGRYWYSFGRFQKDLGGVVGGGTGSDNLVSRLTYTDTSNSGEFFGRVDTPVNVFVKGFVGAGGESSGHLNDEDFGIFNGSVPYSNTVSQQRGSLDYATVDLGYDILHSADSKVGLFAGYNYYKDKKQGYGAAQIANQFSDGVPPIPTSTLAITENDRYDSIRVGGNVDMWLGRGFRLQGDVAYLPYVKFSGLDNHVLRVGMGSTLSPESGHGQGVQLEAIASYHFTSNLSVGVGGRYWAMWVPNATTNSFSTGVFQYLPVQTQRYGLLLQGSYRFSSVPAPVVAKY